MKKAREFKLEVHGWHTNAIYLDENCANPLTTGEEIHVIEYSAFDKAVEALRLAEKELARLNMDAPLSLTIQTGQINLDIRRVLHGLGVES